MTGLDTRRYSHYVRVGDTPTIIISDLVAQINADTDSKVTATMTGAGTGIVFTAKAVGTNFAISKDGILINAVLDEAENPLATTDSVAMKYGEGTPAQVLLLEKAFSPQLGNTNKVYQSSLWWSKTEKTDSTATYDSYTIQWMGKKSTTLSGNLNTVAHEIIVVMPPAATQQAAFESVMAEVFGNAETEETGA